MSLICNLFGHRMGYGNWGGADYGRVLETGVDGIGSEHWRLYVNCCRCGAEFHAGSFHGPLRTAHDIRQQETEAKLREKNA